MGSFRLGSILGFEIRIDYSWFIIFFLILWSFTGALFPSHFPGLSGATYVVMGVAATVLFFASLLAHELSHSLVARGKGVPVAGITLFIFGGMARTRMEAASPGDEFQIAVMGPVMSFALAAAFWAVSQVTGLPMSVRGVAFYLAFLNGLLAVFNLLPGFPLDGGRLFRSLVWRLSGDLTKATRWATNGGKALGYLLIAFGLFQVFGGLLLDGLWMVFIGWFLRNAADTGWQQQMMRDILSGVPAREAMSAAPSTVPADLTLDALLEDYFLRRRYHTYPVMEGDRAVGVITLQRLKEIPREEWATRMVAGVMRPLAEVPVVRPEEPLSDVLQRMQDAGFRRALVVDRGRLVGLITPRDLSDWMDRARTVRELQARR